MLRIYLQNNLTVLSAFALGKEEEITTPPSEDDPFDFENESVALTCPKAMVDNLL